MLASHVSSYSFENNSVKSRLRRGIAKDIPEKIWRTILASVPIACVDVIAYRRVDSSIHVLLGYRKIYPYRNRWALPGGGIIKKESLCDTANRQLEEIGLNPTGNYRLVGVYPVDFKLRSDISIRLCTSLPPPQEPQATSELSRYVWSLLSNLPPRLGSNYGSMLRDFGYRLPGARVTRTHSIY